MSTITIKQDIIDSILTRLAALDLSYMKQWVIREIRAPVGGRMDNFSARHLTNEENIAAFEVDNDRLRTGMHTFNVDRNEFDERIEALEEGLADLIKKTRPPIAPRKKTRPPIAPRKKTA